MKRIFLLLISAIFLIGILGGCTAEAQDENKTQGGSAVLVVRATGDPLNYNPNLNANDNLYAAAQNMFHRLTKIDAANQVIPDLAKDWSWSEDGLMLTFRIREDVKWSDGTPLTSKDVKYTFDAMQQETTAYFHSSMGNVEAIETPDDQTVSFILTKQDMGFPAKLGWFGTFILPEHIYNNGSSWEDNEATTTRPVTSGAFCFGEHKKGESLTLEKSPHAADTPKLDKIIFRIIPDETTAVQALMSGEIDIMEAVPTANVQELEGNEGVRLSLKEYPSPMRVIFNLTNETLADPAVRKAMACCVDREEISEKIYGGIQKPEYSFYPSLIAWASNADDTAPAYDTAAAVACLEEGGYSRDQEGYFVRGLSISVFEGGGYPDTAKLLIDSWKEAGIEVELKVMEANAWSTAVFGNRDFDIELQGGYMGPDPDAMVTRFGSGSSDNVGGYSNPEFDRFLEEGARETDEAKRAKAYHQAQAVLAEDLPYIPIVNYAAYDASAAYLLNLPIDGAGEWGWSEYTYTAAES